MFLKQRSSMRSATQCQYCLLCLPPPCLSLWSPSPWSLPTPQAQPPCPSPRYPLRPLRHLPLPCRAPHNTGLTSWAPCWPAATSNQYRTTPLTHSSSPRVTTQNCRSIHTSRWFSAILVPSSHPLSRYCPSWAPCCSRLLYTTTPSARGAPLMKAGSWTTRRGLEGEFQQIKCFTWFVDQKSNTFGLLLLKSACFVMIW